MKDILERYNKLVAEAEDKVAAELDRLGAVEYILPKFGATTGGDIVGVTRVCLHSSGERGLWFTYDLGEINGNKCSTEDFADPILLLSDIHNHIVRIKPKGDRK